VIEVRTRRDSGTQGRRKGKILKRISLIRVSLIRVSAPILWNNLPQNVRLCESIGSFKSELKTHLFRIVYKDFI
jgi:hypothetical protein